MYLIVGLGNPEPEYSRTRHNMGFDVINKVADKHQITVNKNKFDAIYGKGNIGEREVILVKPQTYMNLSGRAVIQYMHFFKVKESELIVIYDDVDIEKGSIKIRKKGSAGTHNGMKSVIQEIGTEEFVRIRIGIGKPEFDGDMINHVLQKVQQEEYQKLEEGIQQAAEAVDSILQNGIDHAMNKFN